MEGTMNVAIMTGIGKMDYTRRPIPTPKDNEVLVKLEYVGICGKSTKLITALKEAYRKSYKVRRTRGGSLGICRAHHREI